MTLTDRMLITAVMSVFLIAFLSFLYQSEVKR